MRPLLHNRYVILTAAVLLMIFLGATLSWSVFVTPLKARTGLGQGLMQLPFSIFYVAFPAVMPFSGFLYRRFGLRRCAVLGGILYGCGWILAGSGDRHFTLTILGIGLLGGLGVGLAYLIPIATSILWFPRHKGLITGIAVAGFGGGAALTANLADLLMVSQGKTPFEVFRLLGVAYLFLVVLTGSLMRVPAAAEPHRLAPLPWKAVIRQRIFWYLYIALFGGVAAGLAVSANLKQLYSGQEARAGVLAVSVFALANALGRVSWGLVFDRIRSTVAIRLNLILQAALLLGSGWILRSATGLQLFAALAGFNFGGVLVIYASTTARRWGPERVGQVYGGLFSALIPATLAPLLTGLAFDLWRSFTPALLSLGLFLLATSFLVRLEDDQPRPIQP